MKAYLNGVNVKLFMRVQTLFAKVSLIIAHMSIYGNNHSLTPFLFAKIYGTVLSVASGLAVGPEGPLVHIGAAVGSGLTRGPKVVNIELFGRKLVSWDVKWDWLTLFHNDGAAL